MRKSRFRLPSHSVCTAAALALSSLIVGTAVAAPARNSDGFGPAPRGKVALQPLKHTCATGEPQGACRNIGVTEGWYRGRTVNFLYTQNYFCDRTVPAGSANGCEAGQKFNRVPPGTTSERYTDPLFIPIPLFTGRTGPLQCPTGPCVDHPMNIDLSRLAAALGKPAAALRDVPLPGHDHLIASRNHNRPEWWPVYVIGVTDPASFARIERAKNLATALRLAADPRDGVTKPIPTNVFLWFQTLPGTVRHR